MALSNAEKQAQWRARRKQPIRVLEWRVVSCSSLMFSSSSSNERLRNQAAPRSNP
jgi:hypothetical protein